MSVTFSPQFQTTGRFHIVSWNEDAFDMTPFVTFDSYADAELNYFTACAAEGVETWEAHIVGEAVDSDAPEINMANGNAEDVLMALGLSTEDLCGSEDSDRFHERVLLALAEDRLDDERPVLRDGNMIMGGRMAGYVDARLGQLLRVAEYAKRQGLAVTWA